VDEDELEEQTDEREPWETDDDEEEEDSTASAETEEIDWKARAEEAEAKAAQAKAEFEQRRSDLDRSKTRILEAVRSSGLAITEDGKLATVDPTKVAGLITGVPSQAKETKGSEPIKWDLYNTENFDQQLAENNRRVREETIAEVQKAFGPQLQALAGITLQSQQPAVQKSIADAFSEVGYEGMQDTPEFKEFLTQQTQQMDPVSLSDPEWMAQLALTALPKMSPTVKATVREKAEQKRSREKAAAERRENEEQRRQMNPSGSDPIRTYAGSGAGGRKYDKSYDIAKQALSDLPGYDDDLNKALAAGKVTELLEKREKAKSGGRR
jgi:hypothetical protein